MSFNSAMLIANNGLNVHANAIKLSAHNVANVSTASFKASSPSFKELVSANEGVAQPTGNGQGTTLARPTMSFARGSALTDGIPTHLAMQSDGFFIVQGRYSGLEGQYFTRDGSFMVDESGHLVNSDGLQVQGYAADTDGVTGSRLQALVIPKTSLSAPAKTTTASLIANLSGNASPQTFSMADPEGTSLRQVNFTIWDSLGSPHDVSMYFTARGPQTVGGVTYGRSFQYNLVGQAGELATGQANPLITGMMYYDDSGKLQVLDAAGNSTATATVNFKNAAAGQSVVLELGDPITASAANTGIKGITAYANGTSVERVAADGYGQGRLRDISINSVGMINGSFSNGNRRSLGQIGIATFPCNEGLGPVGENLYVDTLESGLPITAGGSATIEANALEQSNVDLGEELIKQLNYQRGYQVNARIIQTVNSMYGDLIRIGQ